MSFTGRRGFSLLEATVAVAIVGMVAAAALAALGAGLRAVAGVRASTEAGLLARERLATLQLHPYGELARLPDSLSHGRFPAPFQHYGWRVRSTQLPVKPRAVARALELDVEVQWSRGAYRLSARRYPTPEEMSR